MISSHKSDVRPLCSQGASQMDWNSLTTQQVALFAAAAIVISALAAGTATLVSTIVSGWNTRRLAR